MSFDGLVTGGIDCFTDKDEVYVKDTVYDLPKWIEKQFLECRKIAENSLRQADKKFSVYRMVWIGDVVYPFCALVVTPSTFRAIYHHAECRNERPPESATLEDICLDIAIKASEVSDLNLKW